MLQCPVTTPVDTGPGGPDLSELQRKWKSGRVVAEREALEPACPGSVICVTLRKLPSLSATVSPGRLGITEPYLPLAAATRTR